VGGTGHLALRVLTGSRRDDTKGAAAPFFMHVPAHYPPPMTSTAAQALALVKQGHAAHQAGDAARAADAYEQALRLQPEQPDALQLLGLLARRAGDLPRAEALMRRSLQVRDAQPHVWNNLGNVLDQAGHAADAEACYARAVALAPGYADAAYNLAVRLHARGDASAATMLDRSLAAAGGTPTPAKLQLKAQIEGDTGRLDDALATLDHALALAPDRAALHHNRGVLLQRRHRHADALQAHDRAAALGVEAADAHYNRGNTLQSLGRAAEAAAAYRAALARDPAHALALVDLARLRWRQGDPAFDAELKQAALHSPQAAAHHAGLLWRADRHAEGAAAYRHAITLAPQAAALHDGLALCLARLGDIPASLAAHARALALAPTSAPLHTHQAITWLMARRREPALDAAARACLLAPDDQHAQAVHALALRVLGDPRAQALEDPRLVGVHDLPPPPGFADMATFNAALAAELAALHGDREAPVDQTLRHGTQTMGDILAQGHPMVDALKSRLTEAIDRHIAALPDDARHPFLRRRQARWRYTDSWSSRLRRQGFHTDHVHPHGWLSACYYVALPPGTADVQRRAGWIRFGVPDFDCGLADPVLRWEQPRPGRLLLFPSMAWHGTAPYDDDAVRLTIAFDVVPA